MRGISMYDSSSVSTLFSSLGSSKSTGSGLFGINLSEYASIRSGSYGKLMRSYFSMDSTKGTSKSDDSTKNTIEDLATTTSTSKDSTKTLAAIESDAKELTDSAKALYTRSNNKVFTKDSGGSYDTDKIYKAVKRFADDYNSMLDTAGKSSTNRISRSVSSMKNETSYNEKPLKEIGITVDEKTGRLSVDETTFKSADTEKIKSLFNGTGSYAYSVATKAAMTESYAKSEAAKSNTYTKNGTYNYNYNSGNIFMDMF
ncbi:MAG TPA: flagellar hook-associated protein [Roseburia sp.]|nr:flagellar hook-associated protein [Roseburia sp.]